MRILIVAATAPEVTALLRALTPRAAATSEMKRSSLNNSEVDVLVTGVGMVATAAWTSRALAQGAYDVALNVGLCGSFTPNLPPGAVAHVVADRIAELGAEDHDHFLIIEELALPGEHLFVNDAPPESAVLRALPTASGITVNTVHGRAQSIADVVRRWHPDVESMEGAAFMHACRIGGVRYAQIRAVSNVVEPRDRAAWKLDAAVAAVNRTALAIVEEL
jgi:futalosine hydrolase